MKENEQEQQLVLIVDADHTRRFLTAVVLQRLGYHVFPVSTAEEALIILDLTEPLVVITEITLPRMSGIDLLKTLKREPAYREVPVIMYTGLKDSSYQEACEQAGCAGYLVQPADHNQLYEAVQKATEARPRAFVRIPTSLNVIVEGAVTREGGAKEEITAISEHGMYVSTPDPLPRGAVVRFTLFLDRSMAWGILVEGTVLYSNRAGDAEKLPGMGVKFTLIRPEDQEAIRVFIGKKLLEGIAVPLR